MMKAQLLAILSFGAGILLWDNKSTAQEAGHLTPQFNSTAFEASFAADVHKLEEHNFGDTLESASLGSMSDPEAQAILEAIRKDKPIDGVSAGDASVTYDVILQPGHYGRRTGAVGTHGALVGERELVAYIGARLRDQLRRKGLNVLVIPADGFSSGLRARIFLALHADGSVPSCSTGPSLAYESTASTLAMHAIGWGLSSALGYSYSDFRRDNFTVNEAHYYTFRAVDAPLMKGLLEVGELTCANKEEALVTNANKIADNLARSIVFVVGQ